MVFPVGHVYTVFAWTMATGFWASINHTRIDLKMGGFFAVQDHAIHHTDITYNYGQYHMFWDWIDGTFISKSNLDEKKNKIN